MADSVGHMRHDPLQVAAALDRGARLAPMVELCARCGALYRDLVALTAALPLGALPARPRAFMLDEREARSLRPRAWRIWWAIVGSTRDTVKKPLAAGFATLGLAGLLLTAIPALSTGTGAAAAPAPAAMAVDRPAASSLPSGEAPDTRSGAANEEVKTLRTAPDEPGVPAALVVSVGLLAAGGSLFVARRVAVRSRAVR